MNTVFNIIQYLFVTAVVVLALLLIATLAPVVPGGLSLKIVQSGSMEPSIPTGSLVIIKGEEIYNIGDVVTFGSRSRASVPTTHRIVDSRISNGVVVYKTKGDANDTADPREIRVVDIIGKVQFSIPYLGFVVDFARKPLGFILLVVVPAGIVLVDELKKIIVEMVRIRREKKKTVDKSSE